MTIRFSKAFIRQYRKLPDKVKKKVDRQLQALADNQKHPGLVVRKMVGQENIWEARIDIHYRMTFNSTKDLIVLRRVGTHEIYRKP